MTVVETDYWVVHACWVLGQISDADFADFLEEYYKDDLPDPILEAQIDRLRNR